MVHVVRHDHENKLIVIKEIELCLLLAREPYAVHISMPSTSPFLGLVRWLNWAALSAAWVISFSLAGRDIKTGCFRPETLG